MQIAAAGPYSGACVDFHNCQNIHNRNSSFAAISSFREGVAQHIANAVTCENYGIVSYVFGKAVYNIFPARELTANTVAIYTKAMTFIQMLALSLPFLRKTRDQIAATAATTK